MRPLTFILDDHGIKTLATLHPNNIRNTSQVVQALGETDEWNNEWSKKILTVVQTYDNELKGAQRAAAALEKTRQKRLKVDLDKAKFQEESDRIRADTECRFRASAAQQSSQFANTDVRRSLRIQNEKK